MSSAGSPEASAEPANGLAAIQLPGLGLPIDFLPSAETAQGGFPSLRSINHRMDWKAATLLLREVVMLKLIEDITNKPEWWIKVKDASIRDKWAAEALGINWDEFLDNADFTEKMAHHCMDELLAKADLYEETGLIPIFDYSTAVIKSDKLIPDDLRDNLIAAVAPLENVPEHLKDWHPGSDGKVLDLVHPSLWPLIYGRSRFLADKPIGWRESLQYCGMGDVVPHPTPSERFLHEYDGGDRVVIPASTRFQWLPCDVTLHGGKASIDSYINNLHPKDHAAVYPIIERFIEQSLPAWDVIQRWGQEFEFQRIKTDHARRDCNDKAVCGSSDCSPTSRPLGDDEAERWDEDEDPRHNRTEPDEDGNETAIGRRERLDLEWFYRTHPINLPEPSASAKLQAKEVKTSGFFKDASKIQVIVKLANIHLTPDNPSYDGGSWHVEGQLNEHISATALFYYDSDNITDSYLEFRTSADGEELSATVLYMQNDTDAINNTFAIDADGDTIQSVGGVLTRPGRAVFFPNVFQHHVSPFKLADQSRPGHRKILALFLVNPDVPIISTANVPPQQREWWVREASDLMSGVASKLPPEVTKMVFDNVDFPITEAEAKEVREELMAERSAFQVVTEHGLTHRTFGFCEH